MKLFPSKLVKTLTGVTNNQLKYWVRIGLVSPRRDKKSYYYTFKDIIKLRVIASLKKNGLSLQRIKKGLNNLAQILPNEENPLSRLIIHTDGTDMIAVEKGKFFSAITKQNYFAFDTEQIKSEIIELQKMDDNRKYKNLVNY